MNKKQDENVLEMEARSEQIFNYNLNLVRLKSWQNPIQDHIAQMSLIAMITFEVIYY